MFSAKVKSFLEKSKVRYEIVPHKKVFTAFDKAMTLGVKPKIVGKTLVVKFDGNYGIVLIPAHRRLDLNKLKKIINGARKKNGEKNIKKVGIVREKWIKENLKGIKEGAVPPFGSLWGLPTFVDKLLMREKHIVVNGGKNRISIKIAPKALCKLEFDILNGQLAK